ncbi:hypothetical protein F8B43_2010 [Methylorubrum populi]|uniref:Uncharacterized protein n=1 Tax=Methylorubrum populi TaxID=223967 RepID=A0A833J768_9HYPH|nr:hypothetical protein F8B43_2010 [Methylorubrum populi]
MTPHSVIGRILDAGGLRGSVWRNFLRDASCGDHTRPGSINLCSDICHFTLHGPQD